jgi:hypothetical protein
MYENFENSVILIPSRREEYYAYEIDGAEYSANKIIVKRSSDIVSDYADRRIYIAGGNIRDSKLAGMKRIDPDEMDFSITKYFGPGRERLSAIGGDDLDRLVPLYIQTFPVKPK